MKFLCIECDEQMAFEEREVPGDGTFAAAFSCPKCGRRIAMLANPMETQLVGALGVKIGGRTLDQQPLELVRSGVVGRDDAFTEGGPADPSTGEQGDRRMDGPTRWSTEAKERLARVPGFVRGMVKRIYTDYAAERGLSEITPEVMDRARSELGLEGM
jgi:predicted RNA-binding Zn-ribbon protein involved in translation (DUF1610 family)